MPRKFSFNSVEVMTARPCTPLPAEPRAAGQAMLIVLAGEARGERVLLEGDRYVIGRGSSSDMHLDSDAISRVHAFIERRGVEYVLVDKSSTNGSFVNYRRVNEVILHDGDQIQIGQTLLKFMEGNNIETIYHEEFQRLAHHDALTGALNRASFDSRLSLALPQGDVETSSLSLILFDLDHFKEINEVHGHTAGDLVLSYVGETVQELVLPPHLFARIGGEEFAIIYFGELTQARHVAENIRAALYSLYVAYDGERICITASLGVVEYCHDLHRLPSALYQAADSLLYQAKEQGRNLVIAQGM